MVVIAMVSSSFTTKRQSSIPVGTSRIVGGRSRSSSPQKKKRGRWMKSSLVILMSIAVVGMLQNVRVLMTLLTGGGENENYSSYYYSYTHQDMPELILRKQRNKPIHQSFQTFVVWTYPFAVLPPTASEYNNTMNSNIIIGSDEMLLCSYPSACGNHHHHHEEESERLNLRELTRDTKYSKFVQNHALYKLLLTSSSSSSSSSLNQQQQQDHDYLHHIQSIAMLALVQKYPQKCVRMLGQRELFCHDNVIPYATEYDPTSSFFSSTPIVSFPNNINNNIINNNINSITFQALTLDSKIRIVKESLVEDELHSLVAAQFYPYVSSNFIDRDTGLANNVHANAYVLASGRYTTSTITIGSMVQLPSSTVTAPGVTFPSVKVGQSAIPTSWRQDRQIIIMEQQQQQKPIGAQDLTTLEFFQQHDMASYLSLSFTLMWNKPDHGGHWDTNNNNRTAAVVILLMDVAKGILPNHVEKDAKRLTHVLKDRNHMARLEHTLDILETMATARVVITSNIEMAFPAIAMGVPVIYVGNATELKDSGMEDVVYVYDPSSDHWNFTVDNFSSSSSSSLSRRLLLPAGVHRIDRARASFWNVLKHTSSFYSDTAILYGMIPLQRLGSKLTTTTIATQQDWLFHFIWTTSPDTFTWREKRAIEHVFYHHPNARVLVHSNTLPTTGSVLDIFVECGYDLVIEPYDLAQLLRTTIPHNNQGLANSFVDKLSEFMTSPRWYSHETDIVRFLMLWRLGGVYLDTDMYLIKPLHKQNMTNVIAYQDPSHSHASGAFMSFKPRHEILKAALEWTFEHYDSKRMEWPVLGSTLMTKLHQDAKYKDTFTVLDDALFYPIPWESIDTCFTHRLASLDLANTYGVHLNTKITSHRKNTTQGTFCDRLLHDYCIFCDEIHTVPAPVKAEPTTTIVPFEQETTNESSSFWSRWFSSWFKRADTTLSETKPKEVIRKTLPLVRMEFVPKQ